jgi:hypothetical protein
VLAEKAFNISDVRFQARKSSIKRVVDSAVESTGLHFDRMKIYADIFQTTKYSAIEEFVKESDKLFLEFPPIKQIDMVEEFVPVISSNTVLVYGETLYKVIKKDFGGIECNFSDQIGFSKPDKNMFRFTKGAPKFHVGDNPITDGAAEKFGIQFIPIENYHQFKQYFKYL